MEGNDEAMGKQWDSFRKIPYQQPSTPKKKKWFDTFARFLGRKHVLPFKIDDWFDESIIPSVRNISTSLEPDIVIVEYVYVSKIFCLFGNNVLKILDTHDVFGGRDQLYFQINKRPLWFYTSEAEEKRGVDRADIILAIQPREAEYFKKLSEKKVLTVGHLIKSVELGDPKPTFPPRLLFVGSSNPSNLDGIKWFLENVFESLRKKSSGIELDIVGNVGDFIEPHPGLNLLGTVEDIAPFYQNASVVINPLQFGTGLKIKSVEALAMKRSLVTTPNGATGIEEWIDQAFLCAETPDEFAAAILQIINSRELRKTLAKGAEEFINVYNQKAFSPIKKEIDAFMSMRGQVL